MVKVDRWGACFEFEAWNEIDVYTVWTWRTAIKEDSYDKESYDRVYHLKLTVAKVQVATKEWFSFSVCVCVCVCACVYVWKVLHVCVCVCVCERERERERERETRILFAIQCLQFFVLAYGQQWCLMSHSFLVQGFSDWRCQHCS